MRLTDIGIRNVPLPSKGQKTYYDDTLKGFGFRVSQGGTRSFVLQHGSDRQLTTLGRYGIITLSEAREAARTVLAERTLGKTRRGVVRFDEALTEYFTDLEERVARGKNRSRTLKDYRRLLGYFNFNRTPLAEIAHDDVTRKLPKAPGERAHALVAIKVFFAWCQKPPRRYIEHNPCEGMTASLKVKPQRRLADAELAAILQTALAGDDNFSRIVALLILSGQRRGEIAALERPWLGKDQMITLPDTITKNKTIHTFVYGSIAANIFASISRLNSTDYLFPAAVSHVRGEPTTIFNSWSKSKKEFNIKCGIANWTLHQLRKEYATRMAELGVLPHIVERLINHKLGSISNKTDSIVSAVAEIYNQAKYLPEMCEAVTRYDAHLTTILEQPRAANRLENAA